MIKNKIFKLVLIFSLMLTPLVGALAQQLDSADDIYYDSKEYYIDNNGDYIRKSPSDETLEEYDNNESSDGLSDGLYRDIYYY